MLICTKVLNAVRVFVRKFIQVAKEIVTTVCEWVATTITVIKEVVEKVCTWLPWPLDKLCEFVSKLIEVVETITKWVCKEVIERIFEWIEIFIEYLLWFISWICWVIDWIPRFIDLLLCWSGIKPTKYIHLCVKMLSDKRGNTPYTLNEIDDLIEETRTRFRQCKIEICSVSVQIVEKEELLDGFEKTIFSEHFYWFQQNECSDFFTGIIPITVFVVNLFANGSKGRAFLNTNFIVISNSASKATIAHEIGHLAALGHTEVPTNVMMDGTTDASVDFTSNQCCLIRSSRYTGLLCRDKMLKGLPSVPVLGKG